MTEQQTLEKILETHPLVHKPIVPEHGWDKDYLYEHLDKMNDIQGYAERLRKDAFDIGAGEDICSVAFGESGEEGYYDFMTPQLTKRLAKNIDEDNRDEMAKYTMNHLNEILDIFKDDKLYNSEELSGLVFEVPIYKIDKKEHDRAVDAIRNFRGISEIAQKGDIRKMRMVVMNGLRNPNLPKWAVKFARVAKGNDGFIKFMFSGEVEKAEYFVRKELIKNGKTDGDKIKRMIKDSIAEAEWEWKEEKDLKDHGDAWKVNIRPLATIAQHAYGSLREEHFEDVESEQDKMKRAKRRHRKGMPF